MKKIVILSAFLSPFRSGAEACAEEVPAQLKDQFEFVIITARIRKDLPREDRLPSGIRVIRVGFGTTFDKWLYPFLAPREAKKLNPDLLHAILETFAGYALMRCKRVIPKAKRILTLQTTNRSFLSGPIIRSLDHVTAISSVLVTKAQDAGRTDDITLIPNGIPYEEIRSACEKYKKVPGRILFVGRLEYVKGVDVLLNAFAKVEREDAILHIVGDGSERSALEKQARDLGIGDRVILRGYLREEELYKEYAEAEVFCGLSRSEALGNVFLEAQAAGCAVVATNIGGIPEIAPVAMLVSPNDPQKAAEAMDHVLTSMEKESVAAAQEITGGFDWPHIAQKYKTVYDTLLSRTN